MWAGVALAVPIAVGVASLIVQTHFTYAYQAGVVFVAGVAGFVAVTWRSRAAAGRAVALWSLVLGACAGSSRWSTSSPAPATSATVLGPARDRPGAGLEPPACRSSPGPPSSRRSGCRRSMRTFLLPYDGISLVGAVAATSLWLAGRRRSCAVLGVRAGAPRPWRRASASAIVARRRAGRRGGDPRRPRSASCRRTTTGRGRSPPSSRSPWPPASCSLPAVASALRVGSPGQRRGVLGAAVLVAAGARRVAALPGRRRSPPTRSRPDVSVARCARSSPPPSPPASSTTTSKSTCRGRSSPTTTRT